MNLTSMLVVLIAVAIITVTGVSFYGDITSHYGIVMPTDINGAPVNLNTFNRTAKVIALAESMEGNQTGIAAVLKGIPVFGDISSITLAGVQVLTMLFEVPGMFVDMIGDTALMLGLPAWIPSLMIALVTILIIFAIVSTFVKWGGTD